MQWNFIHKYVMEFCFQPCVRGYHVFGEHLTTFLGEQLTCQCEVGNMVERHTISVKKDNGETVGHMPKKIPRICSMFFQHGIIITATVTGRRRYSSDLAQGVLEIPCNLRFLARSSS